MSVQDLYLGLVTAAFAVFALTLFTISLWGAADRRAPRLVKAQRVVHRAARPASLLTELGRQHTT